MPRFNSPASVPSNNGVTPRRGGRVSGQVVSCYRAYVPPAGDRIFEEQVIIMEALRTTVLVVLTLIKMVILLAILAESLASVLTTLCSTIDSSITNICNSHGMSCPAVTSLANDLCLMMLSDYNVHNRQEEHKLGSDIRYHHVHIDESNFGKQKNHRGHRVEGIWVFGMVECLIPINEADRFYTYIDHRTGEQELRPSSNALAHHL
ncbi:hypothetical protein G6F58_002647 [Rhizopus delemar]|nr:hypothetical protein G6F58_002647 [Rhizopus delemar]